MINHLSFEDITIGAALAYRNLSVTPLEIDHAIPVDYLTLDEALAAGVASITEISERGSVPELLFRNRADRPVLLIDGEELVGAKQNRVCNLSILAAANADTEIPVSCVEAGRWHWRGRAFSTSPHLHFARGRARKANRVSQSLETCGLACGRQDEVWDDIGHKLEHLGAYSVTTAMSDAFAKAEDMVGDYEQQLVLPQGAVGAVFSLNGQPSGLEIFESPSVCARLSRKLIRSWALDAIGPKLGQSQASAPPEAGIRRFLAEVALAPASDFPSVGLGRSIRFVGDAVAGGALLFRDQLLHATAFASPFVSAD